MVACPNQREVGLSVERLDPQERERTAAELASLTLNAISSCGPNEAIAWREFVHNVLEYISFAATDEHLESLWNRCRCRRRREGAMWWSVTISCALLRFVHNQLAPSINRHLQILKELGASKRPKS